MQGILNKPKTIEKETTEQFTLTHYIPDKVNKINQLNHAIEPIKDNMLCLLPEHLILTPEINYIAHFLKKEGYTYILSDSLSSLKSTPIYFSNEKPLNVVSMEIDLRTLENLILGTPLNLLYPHLISLTLTVRLGEYRTVLDQLLDLLHYKPSNQQTILNAYIKQCLKERNGNNI